LWEEADFRNQELLIQFLRESKHTKKKFTQIAPGCRLGYDQKGCFLHENGTKRYFGIARMSKKGLKASMTLLLKFPEAVGCTSEFAASKAQDPTEKFVTKMTFGLGSMFDDARSQVLEGMFKSLDVNNNGVLSKQECIGMLRKVMPTMSGKQVCDMMDSIDADHNGSVDYKEFVTWLGKNAPKNVMDGLEKALSSDRECVKSVFRVWDKNGDGLITKSEFERVMKATTPGLTDNKIKILIMMVDTTKDGVIDYDEFCNFLFP
jgi:Ca2+-binding EF-hand superfamily protein